MRGTKASLNLNSISDNESGGLASIFNQRDMCANVLVAKSSAQLLPQNPSEWQIHKGKCGTQIVGPTSTPEPLRMTSVAHNPHWPLRPISIRRVSFCCCWWNIKVSRGPCYTLRFCSHSQRHLNQMFTTHGIPEVITSDNVPFRSDEFTAWCKQLGIKHCKLRPFGQLLTPK